MLPQPMWQYEWCSKDVFDRSFFAAKDNSTPVNGS